MNIHVFGITIWEYFLIMFGYSYLLFHLNKEKLITLSVIFWSLIIAAFITYLGLVENDPIISNTYYYSENLLEVAIKIPGAISFKYLILSYLFEVGGIVISLGFAKQILQSMEKKSTASKNT